ncbi:XdhC family protein [Catenuloplanes japonicus]|uniref:XdhC family protein n=1 Tax=Catenuloplanes japonicus TaxID=33876 RepID=UPI00068F9892|nr:XdhC/CoxI family protein [Catenuloplanes japonicus]
MLTEVWPFVRASISPVVLARLVGRDGPGARPLGATMAVAADGTWRGSLSGGCIEAIVLDHARTVLAGGEPRLIQVSPGDHLMPWEESPACNGVLQVLLTPAPPEPIATAIDEALSTHRPITVGVHLTPPWTWHITPSGSSLPPGATFTSPPADTTSTSAAPPADASFTSDAPPTGTGLNAASPGNSSPTIPTSAGASRQTATTLIDKPLSAGPTLNGGSTLDGATLADGTVPDGAMSADGTVPDGAMLAEGTVPDGVMSGGGTVPDGVMFVEELRPGARLIIAGATDLAAGLAALGHLAGRRVEIIDPRPGHVQSGAFPGASLVERAWPDTWLAAHPPAPGDAVLAITHDPRIDDRTLRAALPGPARYVGALGSRATHARRLARLSGVPGLDRLSAPAGLDLGGATTAETALSILAEVVAAAHGRTGSPLSAVSTPIRATSAMSRPPTPPLPTGNEIPAACALDIPELPHPARAAHQPAHSGHRAPRPARTV